LRSITSGTQRKQLEECAAGCGKSKKQ